MHLKKIINQFCNNNEFCYKVTCTVLETVVWGSFIIGLHYICDKRSNPPVKPIEFPEDYRGPQMPNIRFWDENWENDKENNNKNDNENNK